MTTIERRSFLKTAAATAGGVALGTSGLALGSMSRPSRAAAAGARNEEYSLFTSHTLPAPRPAQNVEVLFQTPFPAGNGMQTTPEGLWIIDGLTRGPSGERTSHVYLLSYSGELLREFRTEGETPSGMTSDGETLWIAATYSRDIIRVNAETGETISRHFTPGAGVIYNMPDDPEPRRSPLLPPRTDSDGGPGGGGGGGGRMQVVPGRYREGTGAHGMEWKEGKLWVAVPPARMIYRIDPATWTVEHKVPSVHKRPHGIGFQGDYLWESDTDVSTFYRRDPVSGLVHEAIRLGDEHPQPHGMSIWDGYIWWVDDVADNSWVCRMRIA